MNKEVFDTFNNLKVLEEATRGLDISLDERQSLSNLADSSNNEMVINVANIIVKARMNKWKK